MATVLRIPPLRAPFAQLSTTVSPNLPKPSYVSCRQGQSSTAPYLGLSSLRFSHLPSLRSVKFVPMVSHSQTQTSETEEGVREPKLVEADTPRRAINGRSYLKKFAE